VLELALFSALLLAQAETDEAEPPAAPVAVPSEEARAGLSGLGDYSFVTPRKLDLAGGLTRVSVLSQFPTPSYGYFPLVLHVDNTLGPRQTLKVSFTSTGSGGSHTFARSVEVSGGERRVVSLPIPSHMRYGNVRVRGPGITEKGSEHIYFNPVSFKQRAVLNIGTAETFEASTGSKATYSSTFDVQVVSLTPQEAPGELTAYVGWDTVVLSGAKLEQLQEAQRRALEAYAALGGHLVLMQSARGSAAAFPLLADGTGVYGLGRLTFCEGCGIRPVVSHAATVPVRAIEPKGRKNRYDYDSDGTPSAASCSSSPPSRWRSVPAACGWRGARGRLRCWSRFPARRR
jgi:hypothetical protein